MTAMTRRELFSAALTFPAFTCLLRSRAIAAEQQKLRQPPYESLRKFILPGNDEFLTEKTAFEIREALVQAFESKQMPVEASLKGSSPCPKTYRPLAPDLAEAVFDPSDSQVNEGWRQWIDSLGEIRRFQFFVLPGRIIRYEIASIRDSELRYRVGLWKQTWDRGKLIEFSPIEEHVASAREPWFCDVAAPAFQNIPAFHEQLIHGVPYWRARLDPASGIDVYGSNGIAVGDIDDDGRDEIYVCQPGGLPNRLFKISPEGAVSDITNAWGVDLLDDTSCALFLDLRNSGRQDLVVLRSSGPVLYLNEGDRYRLRTDAFRFSSVPKGSFTGMAAADFDRNGRLDLYLCCYTYFLSEAQYTYPSPYHDARNGPPNFLFRNNLNPDGAGTFDDCTAETGMDENNDRFSFAPVWCDYNGDGWPDLYVANDFGRKNLYRNTNGHFRDIAAQANAEDIGPGMSASWFDYDHDGNPDIYVANMWTDAGQRIVQDGNFAPAKNAPDAYRAHTMGNSLLRNRGDGTFEDVTAKQNVAFGRWAWGSGGYDFDNNGDPEIYVTCGMLTNQSNVDLNGFFWRQVVARSPDVAAPSAIYENGWNAINQFLREDLSWNGHEPNVFHVRRGNRYFDFSGVSGMNFADDSRAFAVTDFDGDGRPDIVLKSRLGPQLRLLQNNCAGSNRSIALRLRGTKSNRDAIGARIEIDGQTKWLAAGSGFLSQNSKTIIFGLGKAEGAKRIQITWPSGLVQQFANLETGKLYTVTEGSHEIAGAAFHEHGPWPTRECNGDNRLALHDTWFLEPVPLPSPQPGPGLFVVKTATPEYEIFRRYLFDWRAPLPTPFAMLLNESGDVAKVYARVPDDRQVQSDLAQLRNPSNKNALPFEGTYVKTPKRDFFKFGAAYLWAGYPDKALPYLERVLRQSPENARVLVLVAQIHFEAGRLDEAKNYFLKAGALDSTSVYALIGLGDIAAKQDNLDEAATDYGKALALDPKSAEAANGMGLALAKQGRLDRARPYFEQAIAARRDYSDAINNLAVLYMQQGKVNDAIAAFNYGIQVSPDEDILYLNLGRTYVQTGQTEKARVLMQQLLDRKPGDATARHALEELNGR